MSDLAIRRFARAFRARCVRSRRFPKRGPVHVRPIPEARKPFLYVRAILNRDQLLDAGCEHELDDPFSGAHSAMAKTGYEGMA